VPTPVFAALHNCGAYFHLGWQQVFPLVPSRVPRHVQKSGIYPHLELSASIAIERAAVVKIALAQWRSEATLALFGHEGQDAIGEECLSVPRLFSPHQERTEGTVRERSRSFGIG
jgi:hypothetical protein